MERKKTVLLCVTGCIAAYKALSQLFTKPFYWEKTLHGLSKQEAPQPEPAP